MDNSLIRVGLIGAGANMQAKHIPGFSRQQNVEIYAVANRSIESAELVAEKFQIPKVCEDWLEIIEDKDIDAVCIGTWPYMHAPITMAAISESKHVLCEARMAMNSQEAFDMLEISKSNPDIVCQIVPAPHTLPIDRTISDLLFEGFLGDLVRIRGVINAGGGFPDHDIPFHWRHDRDLSGNNIMTLGIWYEAIMRWIGPAKSVIANAQVVVKQRKDSTSGRVRYITIPDDIDVLCEMASGGNLNLNVSTVSGMAPSAEIWLHGTQGTIKVEALDFKDPGAPTLMLSGCRRSDSAMQEIKIEEHKRQGWRVEEEFINAIRGVESVTHTNFTDGLKYMQWTDAVTESWLTGQKIQLLLH